MTDSSERQIHWLFVGGPLNGKTVFTDDRPSLLYSTDDGTEMLYKSVDCDFRGRAYRIGVLDVSAVLDGVQVGKMIHETDLTPIPVADAACLRCGSVPRASDGPTCWNCGLSS